MILLSLLAALAPAPLFIQEAAKPFEKVLIPAGPVSVPPGELTLTAELYAVDGAKPETPFVVCLHGKRASRGEYRSIGPRLRELGYPSLAVDLRSGGSVKRVKNRTHRNLAVHGLDPHFLEVLPDIVTALRFAREHYAKGPLLLMGSAASASLALDVGALHPELVDGILAFSPGEFFAHEGKPAHWTEERARAVVVPTFVAGTPDSADEVRRIYQALAGPKALHLPSQRGGFGVRVLWPENPLHEAAWEALGRFLQESFPVAPVDVPDGTEGEGGG